MTNTAAPNLSKVVEWAKYLGDHSDDRELISAMYKEAKEYIEFYDWCSSIAASYVGLLYPGIVAVFLLRIDSAMENVDEWVWVVVGDLPPAYITTDECPNPAAALDGYIGAMEEWVDAALSGQSVANLIPVNVPATPEYAEALISRLDFLDKNILSQYKADLAEAIRQNE